MAMRSVEFVGKAEGIKSHELSVKSLMEKLSGTLSSLKGQKRSLQSELSSLYAELAAAESDTDEDGEPDYGLIASIENQIDQTNEELSETEGEISQTSGELQRAQQEYAEVEEEKQQTLFEIQERARITSQDASKASGMFGAWASVGASLNQSFQANFDALAQAASILDGNVSAASAQTSSGGGGGGSRTGGGIGIAAATGAAAIASSGVIASTRPLSNSFGSRQISGASSTTGGFQYAKGGSAHHKGPTFSSTQSSSSKASFSLGGLRSGVLLTTSQESHSDINLNTSDLKGRQNMKIAEGNVSSAIQTSENGNMIIATNGMSFQGERESSDAENAIRSDIDRHRKWAEQYKVNVTQRPVNNSNGSDNSGSPSKGQREKRIANETEFEIEGILDTGLFRNVVSQGANVEDIVSKAKKDIRHFHENEMMYSYEDMSKSSRMAFVDPKTIFGLNIGNKKAFWNYKGTGSKERYLELAKEIETVKLFHNIKQMSYEQIAQLGGTLGACAQYYFLENAICVEKVGDAYIFQGDGRHRLQAAIEAGISNIPIRIVGEHSIKPRIHGIKPGEKMSFSQADSGHVNPKYGTDTGYSINCQSCVVVFEARLRGYDVSVLPNTKGSVLEKLSRRCNWAWIDPETGKPPEYIYDSSLRTANEYLKFVQEKVVQGGRYTIQFAWKGRENSGHIVNLDRTEDGKLRIKDNQRGLGERSEWIGDNEVLEYLSKMKYYDYTTLGSEYSCVPKMLRIDNMDFNPDVVDYIVEGNVDG